ncbi:MAG: GTP 3',8-cyclase MoaA [Dethiobacter sp.]|jgi:cyclic pyranopterin phosphate synthase|nr:GTP 3',8-cyclase MoaA [Dethiobacter sp.]
MAALLDPLGRRLEYLRVSVVDSCNLRCFYCRPGESCKPREAQTVLSRDKIVQAVRGAADVGIRKVRLTGGEPLLRSDIVGLTAQIAAIPGIEDLSLTTNGTRLAQLAAPLAEAGLKRVNISLDSLDGRNFREITRGGRLKATLAGIEAAFVAGLLPVKINMVVMKGVNDHEVINFARLTLDRDIHIRFIEYMPMLGQEETWQRHYLPSSEIMSLCSTVAPLVGLTGDNFYGPARNFCFEDATGRLGFITPVSQHFCAQCNRLRLTSNGRLKPCLFSDVEVDLLPALQKGENIQLLYHEAARLKPAFSETSPAALGASCGPRGMVEIGG